MITSLLLAGLLSTTAPVGDALGVAGLCAGEDEHHIVLLRNFIGGRFHAPAYEATITALVDKPSEPFIRNVSVVFLKSRCDIAFQQTFGAESARPRAARLGGLNVIDIVTAGFGGSGSSYGHQLFTNDEHGVAPIETPDFGHTNMGGFYIGPSGAAGAMASWSETRSGKRRTRRIIRRIGIASPSIAGTACHSQSLRSCKQKRSSIPSRTTPPSARAMIFAIRPGKTRCPKSSWARLANSHPSLSVITFP